MKGYIPYDVHISSEACEKKGGPTNFCCGQCVKVKSKEYDGTGIQKRKVLKVSATLIDKCIYLSV